MSTAFLILCVLAPIGAIDVLYYHFYRFRLYERDASVAEELTHFVRHLCFVAAVALLSAGTPGPLADKALLVILVVDLVNSALDVALEHQSRASLGGLPRGEYLLHYVGTFGSGLVAAAYLYERGRTFAAAPAWQVAPMLAVGVVLFAIELCLFVRARMASARRGSMRASVA